MQEQYYDQLLNIETSEVQKGFHSSFHYHRYEPTPYEALVLFFEQYSLTNKDRIIDFGCGKGRLNFFVHHFFGTRATGIEMDETFYKEALQNRRKYWLKRREIGDQIQFFQCLAENYSISKEDNVFYFFNPFTVQIFMKVVRNILASYEVEPRKLDIILYYPANEYTYYLEEQTPFYLFQEVLLPRYEHNPYEKFLIYRLDC
ncbi:SAM-dependent methyltransferase [Sutcliffiella cohnii]|uniref:SAM-dependent methyltransferase n=1 Tax=Sutcliffiella cohnii TaxID=33932 RepID=A0A223KLJ8_9BACI|nr:SAM-dependent methyltransferase [Sutcliffiella cohnii]AST90244.1 SAM-dependent methyltransferase [Sutcliffiella cohnii]MED4015713.1 SAM-dependent methyltransferase [Sutcliffiella cohnii]